jgi:UDP-N-acetylglucosamine--N-acetylmuramyl-(pentapeptide) pyrophosphoryl-undecaprenol N-acetylglucosamine transferase
MRMVVAGGGTGGHLFPGLAVAEAWVRSGHGPVLFVGSKHGLEARVVPAKGFAFVSLPVRAARGRGWYGWFEFSVQGSLALFLAWKAVRRFHPQVVVGLGSYSSVPVILAARALRIPVVLLEQNAHPGLANRLLARFASCVCTAFAESSAFFPAGKTVHTGNPVRVLTPRQEVLKQPTEKFTLLVLGGSQGARSLNRAMVEAAGLLKSEGCEVSLIHQTGAADLEWVTQEYAATGVPAEVHAFIDDMAEAYARAHLVVSRAGATTLAELATLGKPAILVPYPFAADDHQRANAEVWVKAGAADMILDRELSGPLLAAKIRALASDRRRLDEFARNARRLATPGAAERVVELCVAVGSKR